MILCGRLKMYEAAEICIRYIGLSSTLSGATATSKEASLLGLPACHVCYQLPIGSDISWLVWAGTANRNQMPSLIFRISEGDWGFHVDGMENNISRASRRTGCNWKAAPGRRQILKIFSANRIWVRGNPNKCSSSSGSCIPSHFEFSLSSGPDRRGKLRYQQRFMGSEKGGKPIHIYQLERTEPAQWHRAPLSVKQPQCRDKHIKGII